MRAMVYRSLIVVLGISGLLAGLVWADVTTPAQTNPDQAAKIDVGSRPPGKIAFLSDGDVWMMDTDGKRRQMVTEIKNARGRLSFSPDNKVIAFSREGKDANNLPTGEGGVHLLHDIFYADVDSIGIKSNWWRRATYTLGAYQPEWSPDGRYIYFHNDIFANEVDYIVPSFQAARLDVYTGEVEHLRKDHRQMSTSMMLPTVTPDGTLLAYVINYQPDPEKYQFSNFGIKVIPIADIMMAETELRKPSPGLEKMFAPTWSPDGQWLACVSTDMRKQGVYIFSRDLSQKRLIFAPSVTQQLTGDPVSWSPDSKWLTFATADGIIYTIDINGDRLTPLTGAGSHSNPTWSK